MNKKLILLLTIFSILTVSFIEQKLSIFIWGVLWLTIGKIIINISLKEHRTVSATLFYFFFLTYFIYSILTNYAYVYDPLHDFFYASDSLHFYSYSEMLGDLKSLSQVAKLTFTDFVSADWKGFAFISGIVAFSSNLVDSNNIIVQKLIIVFFSSMIIPYLYAILINYFPSRKSISLCVIYGLLSYSLFYSAIFIRDVPIGFFFVILIYLFYTPLSVKKFPLFVAISTLTFFIRPEHGIFSILFVLTYSFFYLRENNSKFKYILILPIFVLGFIFISDKFDVFLNTIGTTTDHYLDHSIQTANSSSFGAALLRLPWGVRHVAAGLFSQTLPFPFYAGLDVNGLGFIPLSWAALFWFFIWVVILQLLLNKKNREVIDKRLWLLFMIGIILVLGASVNADTRRIMAVNPIFFVMSMKLYHSWSHSHKNKTIILSIILYLLLLFIYLFIKS